MNNMTGIVMKVEKNFAYIMTSGGEFSKIKIDKTKPFPEIGSEYCGLPNENIFIKTNTLRYTAAACLAFIILLTGGGAYAYSKPVSTVTVSINPAIELKSNIWNKVISVTPLNSDGKKIAEEISLKNKQVDDALVCILNQAKNDQFIDENYKEMDKIITVNISGKELKLSSFESEIKKNDLNVKIDSNGSTVLNNSSNKNKDKLPTNNPNNKSSELNTQTDTKTTINNSEKSTHKSSILNSDDSNTKANINNRSNSNSNDTNANSNNKRNNNDSDKLKDDNYNDKNSSTKDNWIKHDKNSKNEKKKNDPNDSINLNNSSNKNKDKLPTNNGNNTNSDNKQNNNYDDTK